MKSLPLVLSSLLLDTLVVNRYKDTRENVPTEMHMKTH